MANLVAFTRQLSRQLRPYASAAIGVWLTLSLSVTGQAGDLLRGGAIGTSTAGGDTRSGTSGSAATIRSNTQDALARTAQALRSVRAMQSAARQAAAAQANNAGFNPNQPGKLLPNVPNGLGIGGLKVAPGVPLDLANPQTGEDATLWIGAKLPKQTVSDSQTIVTIKQTAEQAILNWETFNIGRDTTLRFDQSRGGDNQGEWIAFNKISDPTGVPSQILGSIEAPGQVYVINQNGIIFGAGSQVNVHGLVASSLAINDNLVSRGLLNNPDSQFLFSNLALPAGSNGTPAFIPSTPLTLDGQSGDVIVQAGAVISSPTSAAKVGGRVALIGPNVSNDGTISTPDGQTILAAGLQVGFAAHATSDPTLRGLDVYVGSVDPLTSGDATNHGLISVARGNLSMVGREVDQFGVADSSTSVSLNGRIDLLANYDAIGNTGYDSTNASTGLPFLNQAAGVVTLGEGSATRILPEWASSETAIGTELALKSQINMQGLVVHLDDDADIFAPNGAVSLQAGKWKYTNPSGNPRSQFVYSNGQIYLDPGAMINVSGSPDVSVPISQNILSLQLRGAELANVPLQRNGLLRGPILNIDIRNTGYWNGQLWYGTPLADASGYVGLIERSVGELTTAGGSVSLNAGASVVMQQGSHVDVSGGWIDYQGGIVKTTRVESGGQLLDIAQATPDRVYDGLYDGTETYLHPRYGIAQTFTHALALTGEHYEDGYLQGGGGGTITIAAPAMALDGSLLGQTVSGPRQRGTPAGTSALSLTFAAQQDVEPFVGYSPTPPTILFTDSREQRAASPFALDENGDPLTLSRSRVAEVLLSPDLLGASGFGTVNIVNEDGDIVIPDQVSLDGIAGGGLTLAAANIRIGGAICIAGGTLNFTTANVSPYVAGTLTETPTADPTRGHFTLAATASLDASGLIVDDRAGSASALTLPLLTGGGTIAISSYDLALRSGSSLNVAGGIAVSATGSRTYGNGGSISLSGGQDPGFKALVGGDFELGSTLLGISGAKGGSLALLAPLIKIGGLPGNAEALYLTRSFFNQGGFASFSLTGLGAVGSEAGDYVPGVQIAPGTVIAPIVKSWLASPFAPDGSGEIDLVQTILPVGVRTPVSLTIRAPGVRDPLLTNPLVVRGDFVMGDGAQILTDPRGSVTISSDTALVLGSIIAPGGSISITGGLNSAALFTGQTTAVTTVELGAESILSTAGTTLFTANAFGLRTGTVLPGGAISVTGNLVAAPGSLIDVSGATAALNVSPFTLAADGMLAAVPMTSGLTAPPLASQANLVRVDSAGGSISLTGGQYLFSDATLRGEAGGATATGGSLLVASGRNLEAGAVLTPLDPTLVVSQSGSPFISLSQNGSAIGQGVVDPQGNTIPGLGYFAVDDFSEGGFAALTLKGTVEFSGPVEIKADRSLAIATGGVIWADSAVNLRAPYVALGQPFHAPLQPDQAQPPFSSNDAPFYFNPTYGDGSLKVRAQLIDVGTLSLQNIGQCNLIADGGDIRGNGTLDVAGAIYLRAGQIYPPTSLTFTIAALDYVLDGESHSGSVTIEGSGNRALPLSAGGTLNIYASLISQSGTLRAPFGAINLGWDGTGTAPRDAITNQSVAITQEVDLNAGSVTSVSGRDPVTGKGIVVPYGVSLDGSSWIDPTGVDISAGGLPAKTINIAGVKVADRAGSVVDLSGGGDLYAYQWVSGIGGTRDVLAATDSFAVLPDYTAGYAPYAPFNALAGSDDLLNGLPGYANDALAVGDRIYLAGGSGLSAGYYTLLPARYALLPGSFLVTPQSGTPYGAVSLADGSGYVSGYRVSGLGATPTAPLLGRYAIASSDVVRARSEYRDYFANSFLRESALDLGSAAPRLPLDAGQLVISATQTMSLLGSVTAERAAGARGAMIDLSSPADILIAGPGVKQDGVLVLNADQLSAFGADSLLIGGIRETGEHGTIVNVTTGNLTVDNQGSPLTGPDIILVANQSLTLTAGAEMRQTGALSEPAETLFLGDDSDAGSGNGALLRVSADRSARIIRAGVDSSTSPLLTVGAGARIVGQSVILDSTAGMSIDPLARLSVAAVTLNSGQISLALDNPGTLAPGAGLVLSGAALASLQGSARELSLLSYSSIDLYGTGEVGGGGPGPRPTLDHLSLQAGEIRGFNNGGGTVTLTARHILLANSISAKTPGAVAPAAGTLKLNADTIELGRGQLAIDQFSSAELEATGGLLAERHGGLSVSGDLTIKAPLLTAKSGAEQAVSALGALTIERAGGGAATLSTAGLGASLALAGQSVSINTDILLSSGTLSVQATGGNVRIGDSDEADLNVAGTAQQFFDLTKYTPGGEIILDSENGDVVVASQGKVNVAAGSGGGNAGTLTVTTDHGQFLVDGVLAGRGGAGGSDGSFSLEAGELPSLAALDAVLNNGGFTGARSYRVLDGDVAVDGLATAHQYSISADAGSITVTSTGLVDASGATGGAISLQAAESVTLLDGSALNASADDFDAAGKGGAIALEAGADINGVASPTALLDLQTGSRIDLSVAANQVTSAAAGQFTGTLHLRAPQTTSGTDLQANAINSTITGADRIEIEGYKIYAPTGGTISTAVQTSIKNNATVFAGAAGTTTASYAAMRDRLLANNAGLSSLVSIEAGAEIINRTGNLTLPASWDLSTYRFGPDSAPGVLTLRAAGNLVFTNKASLSDGFGGSSTYGLWDAPLLAVGTHSWSYRLVAGADFAGADFHDVKALADLGATTGSLLLGNGSPALPTSVSTNTPRSSIVPNYFQTIRTGTGDIDIAVGRDLQLLNPLATIYTAGTQAEAMANFDAPVLSYLNSTLGTTQNPIYPAQFSLGGGNLTITAQNNIGHYRASGSGASATLLADSSKELPTNWLYRRGWVDPATGQFGQTQPNGDVASTAWWVDFSNFFEGVGTLGGGNVSLTAGHDISNVDAVVVTNARMPKGTPAADKLLELGGGDLSVQAGHDLDGGVYYVERGQGTISAGRSIHTNVTRAALNRSQTTTLAAADPTSWLPTTLFLGKGSFDVFANEDVLLGPVANPFLLPQGINNSYLEKTYFSTYAATDAVNVSSLSGDVTIKDAAAGGGGSLLSYYQNIELSFQNSQSFGAQGQPWLRLVETSVSPFAAAMELMPPTLRATSFGGDINLVGSLTLAPAARGTVDLAAAGSINGLAVNARDNDTGSQVWSSAAISLSDADPNKIPSSNDPLSFAAASTATSWVLTSRTVLGSLATLFNESGSTQGSYAVIQTKQALHAPGLLHADDPEPVHIYATSGDISGLTLFSGKFARLSAGEDVTDIGLYLQNVDANDVSLVSAGRDIVAYDPNSALRQAAQLGSNQLLSFVAGLSVPASGSPTAGDIQINGPGTLEVLAGRNLDLGVGENNPDGTQVGITSIGNARNPYLPFDGANIIAAAGVSGPTGLASSALDFNAFSKEFVEGPAGAPYLAELGDVPGLTNVAFDKLTKEQQAALALDVFYFVLRDAGRDHNTPGSPGFGTYASGFAAIDALFANDAATGDITTRTRDIRTRSGGSISLLAPGGSLTLANTTAGNALTPPGIITEAGGAISIFTDGSVDIGVSRIFTLRGGDEIIWSTTGDIAAGSSSKTVQSAPPTRVLIDPQSGDVKTDLAGLATGGGIGVLATVEGVPPGNVDLIAPAGVVDAGDAGIRATGNLNVAAVQVLNAENIQVAGSTAGTPVPPPVAAPNLAGIASAASATGAVSNAAQENSDRDDDEKKKKKPEPVSIIVVEVLGYGGAS